MGPRNKKDDFPEVGKIETGIDGFDKLCLGGIPEGRTTLVTGTSGSGKTVFGVQFLVNGIQKHQENGVFVAFEESIEEIKRNMKSFDWDLHALEQQGQFSFVDASPDQEVTSQIIGEFDLSVLLTRVKFAVEKVGAKRVVIDSIGSLFSQFAETSIVRRELTRIVYSLKMMGVTTMITAERTEEYGAVARFDIEEFVADTAIILRHSLTNEKRRRTVEVLKLRGANHQNGEYPFIICQRGIEVILLSEMKLTMSSSAHRISSGNIALNNMCQGGFFRDSIILVCGPTGIGKTLLTTTFLDAGCQKGDKTLLIAFEESQSQILRNTKGWGMDLNRWIDSGLLEVDCSYPEATGLPENLLRIKEKIIQFQPTRIAIDSLTALERVSKGLVFQEFLISLTSFIKEQQIAGLITSVSPALAEGKQHLSAITDAIILLRYIENNSEIRRCITVLKMRGSKHEQRNRRFEISHEGLSIGDVYKNDGKVLGGLPNQRLL